MFYQEISFGRSEATETTPPKTFTEKSDLGRRCWWSAGLIWVKATWLIRFAGKIFISQ
jgi:hypothetical protein